VSEKEDREGLQAESERGGFLRAVYLAESHGLQKEEVRELQLKALWEMAAVNRNAPGTKTLAQTYGLSKKELRELLDSYTEKERNEGKRKPLEPCYDISTGKYMTFEEWKDNFFKKWDTLSVS
jgi:hypothetical protein